MGVRVMMMAAAMMLLAGCSATGGSVGGSVAGASPLLTTQNADDVPVVEEDAPVLDDAAKDDLVKPEEEAAPVKNVLFMRGLTDKPNGTNGDAYKLAVMLYHAVRGDVARSQTALTPSNARRELINLGVIDDSWPAAGGNVEHQDAAYIFARCIEAKGGVLWTLTGSRRYAHREMIDRGLFPRENPRQYMSGAGVLSAFRDCRESMRAAAEQAAAAE